MLDTGLYLGYILFGLVLVTAILLPLINAMSHPATLVKSLAGVLIVVVIFGVSYAMSDAGLSAQAAAKGVSETGTRLIGAGIYTLTAMIFVAIIGVVFTEIKTVFK